MSINDAMGYDDLFVRFVYLDGEDFDAIGRWIRRLIAAYEDAQAERGNKEGN